MDVGRRPLCPIHYTENMCLEGLSFTIVRSFNTQLYVLRCTDCILTFAKHATDNALKVCNKYLSLTLPTYPESVTDWLTESIEYIVFGNT